MTRKGGTSQACASCKYQRRRCKVDCPLAPYFPADQPNMFQNAHRLFGVSNIIKILKQIDPSQRGVAMKSIIDQANARAKYPVYGCVAEIQQLMLKIQLAEEELQAVQAQLAFYRQHNQQQQQEISSTATDSVLPLQLGTLPPPLPISPPTNANGFSLFHQDPPPQYCNSAAAAFPVSHPSSYSNAAYNTSNAPYVNSKDNNNNINSLWIQQHFTNTNSNTNNNNNTVNPMMMQQPQMGTGTAQPITIQQQEENIQDYDEIHPFFDTIDDRQSYIDSKEAYESSSESSLKDIAQSVEHVSENELKSAAACFSLTSVNL